MTLQEFITTYQGKKVDWDNAYGAQCVDLFRFYVRDVLGIAQPKGVIGAKDFWTAYKTDTILNTNFTQIPNTPEGVPQPGDVMIWGTSYGTYGHIAIVTKADVNSFTALSQNDPLNRETHLKNYNYNGVLGWLRPKKGTMADVTVDAATYEMLVSKATKYDELVKQGYVTKADYDKRVGELQAELDACRNQPPATIVDMDKWELNGLNVVEGNKTFNYKLKA